MPTKPNTNSISPHGILQWHGLHENKQPLGSLLRLYSKPLTPGCIWDRVGKDNLNDG